jgi:trimethylamine---corrinoid protein Co-methyltransferase
VESALTFDEAFIEALIATADTKQCLAVVPTLLISANAPATLEGALVRFTAEAMAGIALAQALCPGQPVSVGATVADVSMRNGLPLISTGNALSVLGAAIAMARRWNLAFYACGPATNAKGFDALGTAETSRWLTAAYHLGANAIIGAIGTVDLDNGISIEKLIVDAEVVADLGRPLFHTNVDASAELRMSGPDGIFLGTEAARALAHRQLAPRLASNSLFESWVAAGSPMIDATIGTIVDQTATPVRATIPMNANMTLLDRRPTNLADLAAEIYSRSIRDAFGFKG